MCVCVCVCVCVCGCGCGCVCVCVCVRACVWGNIVMCFCEGAAGGFCDRQWNGVLVGTTRGG